MCVDGIVGHVEFVQRKLCSNDNFFVLGIFLFENPVYLMLIFHNLCAEELGNCTFISISFTDFISYFVRI